MSVLYILGCMVLVLSWVHSLPVEAPVESQLSVIRQSETICRDEYYSMTVGCVCAIERVYNLNIPETASTCGVYDTIFGEGINQLCLPFTDGGNEVNIQTLIDTLRETEKCLEAEPTTEETGSTRFSVTDSNMLSTIVSMRAAADGKDVDQCFSSKVRDALKNAWKAAKKGGKAVGGMLKGMITIEITITINVNIGNNNNNQNGNGNQNNNNNNGCGKRDPHFTGYDGKQYDFHGEDGKYYTLFGQKNGNVAVVVKMRSPLTLFDPKRKIQRTYFGEFGISTKSGDRLSVSLKQADNPRHGYKVCVKLNDEELSDDTSTGTTNVYFIAWDEIHVSTKDIVFKTKAFWLNSDQRHFNVGIRVRNPLSNGGYRGILGFSLNREMGHNAPNSLKISNRDKVELETEMRTRYEVPSLFPTA